MTLNQLAARQHGVVSRQQLLDAGFKPGAIERRLEAGRLHGIHRGVYAIGRPRIDRFGRWLAAVLAGGEGAVLSHRSAACLWGLRRDHRSVDVTSTGGRAGRSGLVLHHCQLDPEEATARSAIPVTNVARTLFDLAEVVDDTQLSSACEEADRLNLLELRELERVVERGWGRHALKPIRPIVVEAGMPTTTKSPLEDRFLSFCIAHGLPEPATNLTVLGHEVDALWADSRLIAELDSWEFHHHRKAFERDRARDAAHLIAGYRVIRITDARLRHESAELASELRLLLGRS